MSVKKSSKQKLGSEKGLQSSEKKHKNKPIKSTQPTPIKKESKVIKLKSENVPKTGSPNVSDSDKHSKLKDRKKFKRMKALERKNKKLIMNNSSSGDKKDSKTTVIQTTVNKNKSSKIRKAEKSVCEKVREKLVTDSKQSKDNAISKRKKEKSIKWKKQQMTKKWERKNKLSKVEKKDELKGKVEERKNKTSKVGKKDEIKGNVEERKNKTSEVGKKGEIKGKVHIAKTAVEATANWAKLQQSMSKDTQTSTSRKRKIPYERLRNPKLRKMEEGSEDDTENDEQTKEPEIWFDDVDEILLDRKPPAAMPGTSDDVNDGSEGTKTRNPLVKPDAFKGVTKIVCMDCEMVGVGDGTDNMLARVSVVNQYGEPIYDKFVKPKEEIVDYRTHVSGVRPSDLEDAEEFEQVQKDVAGILKGRTLIGHAIKNDLKVLYLSHPKSRIRDTSRYKPFKQLTSGRTPSLKKLSEKLLSVKVQEGEHNSIQDAQATMRLYTMYRKQWEGDILKNKKGRTGPKAQKT